MQTHTQILTVTKHDLDELNHVNNVRYLEWIQEISKNHWVKATDETMRKDLVWVVKNHNIDYDRSALLGDTLEVHTYIKKTQGPISIRVVQIKNNKNGQLLVKATTEWCLLDANTLRPKRVPEAVQKLFNKA